jgi:predicted acylesterase/phospholipase RssA
MESGKLIDYLMASARFPGLINQGPDDQSYFDGGVYDNAPISVLRDRGISRLIIVDISNMKGMAHRQDFSCAQFIYIRPYDAKELGESFDFNQEKTAERIEMGYLDAKKAFGLLSGKCYYFSNGDYLRLQQIYGFRVLNEMELLAASLGVPRITVYTANQFIDVLKRVYVDSKQETEMAKHVLGHKILSNSEGRKDALKAIANRDKKNVRFKTAIDLLEEMTADMQPRMLEDAPEPPAENEPPETDGEETE